jgi:hypothetical protein
MNYQNKYLRYKKKYLELRQKGGVDCSIVNFTQHNGECWHDSLLTIFFFSDIIGDRIRKIVNSKNIDYFLSRLEHEFLLPLNINNYDEFECYINIFEIYISNIIKRLNNKIEQNDTLPDQSKLLLQKEISKDCSITSTVTIKNIVNIKQNTKLLIASDKHGGNMLDSLITIQTINYFFQQDNYFINSRIIYNNQYKYILNKNSINKLTLELLDKTNAIYISVLSGSNTYHAVCLFRCNTQCMYYDDNGLDDDKINVRNVIMFDWYTFIKKYIEESNEDLLMLNLLIEIKKLYNRTYFNRYIIICKLVFLYQDTFCDKLDYYKKITPNLIELYSEYKSEIMYNRLYSKEIILLAVNNNSMVIQYLPTEFKNNVELALAAVNNNGLVIEFLPEELKENEQIALAAVNNNGLAIKLLPEKLKENEQIALAAVNNNGLAIKLLPEKLKENEQIALTALKNNIRAKHDISITLLQNKEIQKILFKK